MIDRIANCRIVEELASGGMAVVYKAVQEPLRRTVAVKALKAAVVKLDPQLEVRFQREALSLATLQHQNVIHVYDFLRLERQAYIIMEYVDGVDLFDLLERTPILPVDVAAIIALHVARALEHAHYHGIVHRDVKPANVLVARSGVVKLTDFGIARDRTLGDMTEAGTGLGTPSYMSPEQILGDRLDFRSDLFSLGVVLYQMVCGGKPFVEDDQHSVMHQIRLGRYASPRAQNREVDRELDRIIARCLRKRREDRWGSTQELVQALELFAARRCAMSYQARLVLQLRAAGVLSEEEAAAQFPPGAPTDPAVAPVAALLEPRVRRLTAVQGGVLLALALLVGGVRLAAQRSVALATSTLEAGQLRVVVNPWAEVWIDGRLAEITPFARPIALAPGRHRLEVRHPTLDWERREIVVRPRTVETLRFTLARRR